MTRCEVYNKEIKKEEWREHIISEKHLKIEQKHYCNLFNMKSDPKLQTHNDFKKSFF